MVMDHLHHLLNTLIKRTADPIRLQFIVFDKIDTGFAERLDQMRGIMSRQTNTRLDNGADEGSFFDLSQSPRALDPETGASIGICKGIGQAQIKQLQSGDLLELK